LFYFNLFDSITNIHSTRTTPLPPPFLSNKFLLVPSTGHTYAYISLPPSASFYIKPTLLSLYLP
jgi:hypothetical protein